MQRAWDSNADRTCGRTLLNGVLGLFACNWNRTSPCVVASCPLVVYAAPMHACVLAINHFRARFVRNLHEPHIHKETHMCASMWLRM